jgi:beta-hydroxylase
LRGGAHEFKRSTVTSVAEQPAPPDERAPAQRFGTDGIKPMQRASLLTRVFMRVVAGVERLNLSCSKVGNPPFYDNRVFPWVAEIEREWPAIREELDRVLTRKDDLPGFHEISSDVATISQDRDWKTFMLAGYGLRSAANIASCPQTWRICQKIPGLLTVMFSILEPGKHLPPHRGPYNGVLRLHLGLIVPEPRDGSASGSRMRSIAGGKAKRSSSTMPSSTKRGTGPHIRGWFCLWTS